MRRCSFLLVAVLLGCATRSSTGAAPAVAMATPVGPPAPHVPGTVCGATPRDDDRCPVLDDPAGDRDGCPDATIAFDPGQTQGRDAQALLVDLAAEIVACLDSRRSSFARLHPRRRARGSWRGASGACWTRWRSSVLRVGCSPRSSSCARVARPAANPCVRAAGMRGRADRPLITRDSCDHTRLRRRSPGRRRRPSPAPSSCVAPGRRPARSDCPRVPTPVHRRRIPRGRG